MSTNSVATPYPDVATDIDEMSAASRRHTDRLAAQALISFQTDRSKSPVAFGLVGRDLRYVAVNETFAAINGTTIEGHVGRLVADIVPDLWPDLEPLYRRVLDDGEALLGLEVGLRVSADPTRQRRWLTSYYPVPLDGEVAGIGIVLVDVTAARRSEKALQLQADLLERAGQAIIAVDPERTIIAWNKAAEQMYGWTAAEAIGRTSSALIPRNETPEQVDELTVALRRGETWSGDFEFVRRHGEPISVFVTYNPILDDSGRLVAVIGSSVDVTERLEAQRALEASRRRLADAQRIAHLGSYEIDLVSGDVSWSEELRNILGVATDVGSSLAVLDSMVHPEDSATVRRSWFDLIERGLPSHIDFRIVRPDGDVRHVRARAVAELGPNGDVIGVSGTLLDDTERVEAQRVRRAAEMQFEIGFEQSAVGAVIADLNGMPTRVNSALCSILGRSQAELLGLPWSSFTHPDDPPLGPSVLQSMNDGHDSYDDERRYIRPDGTVVWVVASVALVRNEDGQPAYYFGQMRDTTRSKTLEVELAHQALHDSLTGLPNRALLTDRLVQALAASRRRGAQLGVIFLDIDEFKVVNDSSGHGAGDALLRDAAARITEAVRPGDTVARFGGDEFVVVCDGVSAIEIDEIAQRVLDALGRPSLIRGHEIRVTASVGIAIADEHATPESLLRDSDAAMYRAKERGKGRIELFDDDLRVKAERRFSTASQLHVALERGELVNYYQPVIDLHSGRMVRVEALVRWEHPTRGLLEPVEFITLAEETGLIVPIGEWVLERACRDTVDWHDIQRRANGGAPLSLAVNMSVRQLVAAGVVELVAGVLARTGMSSADLCLELTESVFMQDAEYFGRVLTELKALGVRLAIDDFGTGYSSISYLKRFPVDSVKVDRGFVDGLGTEPHDSALVAAIVAMAGALELDVVAEGVETAAQLKILEGLGVGLGQGFLFAEPVPAETVACLVRHPPLWPVR